MIHVRATIQELKNTSPTRWSIRLVAFVSDNSGESLAARNIIAQKIPGLLIFPCYAHQINLIVGDYFNKCGAAFLEYIKEAEKLITWMQSKTFVLAMLRDIQLCSRRHMLTVLRAVITHWTAHYFSIRCLLKICSDLTILIMEDKACRQSEDKS